MSKIQEVNNIKRNYSNKITIQDIAQLCHCSESYVSRIFKSISGHTIINYMNEYRLEQSTHFLKNNNFSITEVSGLCGFEDSNYYSNAFHRKYGLSPSEYRKQWKLNPFRRIFNEKPFWIQEEKESTKEEEISNDENDFN